jgi:hypothetical protein
MIMAGKDIYHEKIEFEWQLLLDKSSENSGALIFQNTLLCLKMTQKDIPSRDLFSMNRED